MNEKIKLSRNTRYWGATYWPDMIGINLKFNNSGDVVINPINKQKKLGKSEMIIPREDIPLLIDGLKKFMI